MGSQAPAYLQEQRCDGATPRPIASTLHRATSKKSQCTNRRRHGNAVGLRCQCYDNSSTGLQLTARSSSHARSCLELCRRECDDTLRERSSKQAGSTSPLSTCPITPQAAQQSHTLEPKYTVGVVGCCSRRWIASVCYEAMNKQNRTKPAAAQQQHVQSQSEEIVHCYHGNECDNLTLQGREN